MGLRLIEEICDGCLNARWHICKKCYGRPSFCHCVLNSEVNVDFASGYCPFKTAERREPGEEAEDVQKGV